MTDTTPTMIDCAACGRPVDRLTAHDDHEPGCPYPLACRCDLPVHPECCSICRP